LGCWLGLLLSMAILYLFCCSHTYYLLAEDTLQMMSRTWALCQRFVFSAIPKAHPRYTDWFWRFQLLLSLKADFWGKHTWSQDWPHNVKWQEYLHTVQDTRFKLLCTREWAVLARSWGPGGQGGCVGSVPPHGHSRSQIRPV
jgi:hypothetical protein